MADLLVERSRLVHRRHRRRERQRTPTRHL